ncbi:unnamed protein product [Macrosiphum euphorbiae]|uniref:Uncharacterized protein n=1 Tax=Macrosiphum euphorbiae TaxID=13131 RepID=A0AAV0VN63_9HEMI|nr:unnamed protein product [Macrosiphum euphorbiae]
MVDNEVVIPRTDVCNPLITDEVCMKIPITQQLSSVSTESIGNKLYEFYNMFMSQASTLSSQQLTKINASIDTGLGILYEGENNLIKNVENQEPVNKNAEKQLRFYSIKKQRVQAPEEQRLNKPTLTIRNQIIADLKGNDQTPYIHIDSDHTYTK